jgi:electron transfer flavoprotein alpha subunit
MKAGVVVIAETAADGLTTASRGVISFAGLLAETAGEDMLVLVPAYFPYINQPPCHGVDAAKHEDPPARNGGLGIFSYKEAEEIAAAAGCDVAVLAGDHLSAYSAEAWMAALSPVCGEINPRFICIPHTSRGWDYGPGLAIRLKASLIGAVEDFLRQGEDFFFKRSFLKGQWQMKVIPEKRPAILTVLPEARGTEGTASLAAARAAGKRGRPPCVSFLYVPATGLRTKSLGKLPAAETAYDFSEAEVIVAAGKGIGAVENLDLIKRLAGVFPKSAVGCSRAVCDLGWMEYRRQIGLTGRTVAPSLYIACGISGAMPHLAGMRNSRCIVAVNRDKNAAIFQIAHLGITEDLLTFIPAVLELLENRRQENSDD